MPSPSRVADARNGPLGAPGAPSALSRWLSARIDDAAEALAALGERLRPPRKILFVEDGEGTLRAPGAACRLEGGRLAFEGAAGALALRDAHVEFRLSARRCVLREVELPARAADFLEGVLRAQIDRFTPWRAGEAAFGWAAPVARAGDRIVVTVAAIRQESVAALLGVGAEAVAVTTQPDAAAPIVLVSRRRGATSRRGRWRFLLTSALWLTLALGVAAAVAQWSLGARLQAEIDDLSARLGGRRAELFARERMGGDPAAQALEQKKRAAPLAVVVLEALTRAVPDDAYLTEFRFKGDKIEISGVAADAAALIRQIEQVPPFSQATFTAPTTRGEDGRDTFRIEAHVIEAQAGASP